MFDVAVIGGGIAGCTTAYYLATDGVDVAVLDQFGLNTQASGCNAGSLHAQIQHEPFFELGEAWARAFSVVLPFYANSIALWQAADREFAGQLGVAQVGGLLIARSDAEMRAVERKAQLERDAGLPMHIIAGGELRDVAPYVADAAVGAALCPIEGKANPLLAAPTFAAAAERLGASVLRGHKVEGIRRQSGFELQTNRGRLHARRVVCAAGVDTARIAALVGAAMTLESSPIQLSVTEPMAPLINHLVYSAGDRLTLKQTAAGTVVIGGGWPAKLVGKNNVSVSSESLRGNLEEAIRAVPALCGARIVRSWAALVNGNESWWPIIGALQGQSDFFVNYVPWMGFSGAPAAGRIVSSLVQGRQPPLEIDVAQFAP